MTSAALTSFLTALSEVNALKAAGSVLSTSPTEAARVRATGRAQTVLLSSHFERYFYAVNEEAVGFINGKSLFSNLIPQSIRLLHSKNPIEEIAGMNWENRSDKMFEFVASDAWLWGMNVTGNLAHDRLLAWMSAPKPKNLVRYYRYWGIQDIFTAITRTPQTRNRIWLGVQELVDRRNAIAHGDFTAQATGVDVKRYANSAELFCSRADKQLSRALGRIAASAMPW